MITLIQGIGALASIVGLGSGLVSQAANIHRQLNPPAQVAQAPQNCTPPYQPVIIIDQGVRRVVCAQPVQP